MAANGVTDKQKPLTAEQESHIGDWLSSERFSGTIVSKESLRWYANRLKHANSKPIILGEDWVEEFLRRHQDFAKHMIAPPHPSRENREPKKPLNRLQAMAQQDRTRALYGESPPSPREPAPYPEGQILYNCLSRYVVRHGNLVTKYTTHPHGIGAHDVPNEALALQFVKEHTTIPVPAVISSSWDRITMDFVEGQTLQQAWMVLMPDERLTILSELAGYMAQLRALRGLYIGRLNGEGAIVPSIMTRSGGPFYTMEHFHDFLVRPPRRLETQSMYWHQITTQLRSDCPIVFTHGDIAARNIMVRDGHIVAILDWEIAGWYPEYWDYVFAIRGMDKVDWETLGQHMPSLFSQRYNLEYILVQFILSLS